MKRTKKVCIVVMAVVMGLALAAQADLVVSAKIDTPWNTDPVNCDAPLSNDLVNSGSSVVSSWDITADGFGGSNAVTNDGSLDGFTGSDSVAAYDFKVSFNTAVDVNEIRLFSGWSTTNRMNQNVAIYYKLAGDDTLRALGSQSASAGTNTLLETIWKDDTNAKLLSNIDYLLVSFAKVNGQGTTIKEIDVIGAPVPEPATMGLLAVGAIAGIIRRR